MFLMYIMSTYCTWNAFCHPNQYSSYIVFLKSVSISLRKIKHLDSCLIFSQFDNIKVLISIAWVFIFKLLDNAQSFFSCLTVTPMVITAITQFVTSYFKSCHSLIMFVFHFRSTSGYFYTPRFSLLAIVEPYICFITANIHKSCFKS